MDLIMEGSPIEHCKVIKIPKLVSVDSRQMSPGRSTCKDIWGILREKIYIHLLQMHKLCTHIVYLSSWVEHSATILSTLIKLIDETNFSIVF